MNKKNCFYCGSKITKKNGKKNGVQRYKCYACNKVFVVKRQLILDQEQLWKEYVQGKQTYAQLAEKYSCSIKTIKRKLDAYSVKIEAKTARKVIVLMNTTYWGRAFGVMLFKDNITKENLLKYYVKNETNSLYIRGVQELKNKGFEIVAIVCDGRKGLLQSFEGVPVQMCQFHQKQIVVRYLTMKPKLQAGQELMKIVDFLTNTDKESFEGALGLWY